MQPKIYLLTGAVQTGKTTSLMQWCKGKKNVSGILAPVINAKRMFLDIGSEEVFAMEADEAEIDVLKVGRFAFSASAFEKAKNIIAESKNCNYLVIDEVGPLELREEGLFTAIQQVLQNQASHIVLVIREGLIDKVTAFFHIKNATIISKTNLEQL